MMSISFRISAFFDEEQICGQRGLFLRLCRHQSLVSVITLGVGTHLLHGVGDRDELGREHVARLDLAAAVDDAERARADLLQDVVVVVDAVLRLDVDRLRDVLGVNVEHELVVVLHLALLTADLLSLLID